MEVYYLLAWPLLQTALIKKYHGTSNPILVPDQCRHAMPLPGFGLASDREAYNDRQRKARRVVERLFGVLKVCLLSRFHPLNVTPTGSMEVLNASHPV